MSKVSRQVADLKNLKLSNIQTMDFRNLVLHQKESVEKELKILLNHLKWTNVEPKDCDLVRIYKNQISLLDDVQGALLNSNGTISFDGDF